MHSANSSRFLPNITGTIRKHWNILQKTKDLYELFEEGPVTAFKKKQQPKRNNLKNTLEKGKVKKLKHSDIKIFKQYDTTLASMQSL